MIGTDAERDDRLLSGILLGDSLPMRRVRERIARLARTQLPVLVDGPTGSGKELVATGLHLLSGRSGKFVAVNICAISDTMFEDALFGHARGAFTGAIDETIGYFGESNGGTLFLDEVGALPLILQTKLLRVLETRQFRPVGAKCDRQSNFRLVAATNEDLEAAVASGRFREDLLFRLRAGVIRLPPLVERREDVAQLARYFARLTARADVRQDDGTSPTLSDAAIELLDRQMWRGNVRELRHVIELAVVSASGAQVGALEMTEALRDVCGFRARQDRTSTELKRRQLIEVLRGTNGSKAAAARRLGISLSHLYRLIQSLRISERELGDDGSSASREFLSPAAPSSEM